MYKRIYLNEDWLFTDRFSEEFLKAEGISRDYKWVSLPHAVCETPFNCFDEKCYQKVCGYKKRITFPLGYKDKSGRLRFEGIAHKATVYINGEERATHACGYTGFSVDISKDVVPAESIEITVKVDSRETLNQPPFGFVIDYMTYGGIYRDVYLDIGEKEYIDDMYLSSNVNGNSAVLSSAVRIKNPAKKPLKLIQTVAGTTFEESFEPSKTSQYTEASFEVSLKDIKLWDVNDPNLYTVVTKLVDPNGDVLDERTDSFGFRTSEFKKDGYYLNGKKIKIMGLNRHQSYPYCGYAMPASMQRYDADILKYELGLNAVRTSHYPQSQDFINRCDEIGLLVFMEIPGWQHIGDEKWQDQAVKNVEEMVIQFRNHPSIIMWGVRINESKDLDELYKRTNETARNFDPTRPTGGVRNFKKSHLLEDVYTYNDFSHNGTTKGCDAKSKVTSDVSKAYLITEYNGHMFPSKAFDNEAHRLEHAMRHAAVVDAVKGEKDIAGSFGWCMFDYNTHREFGSGDRICYHGVTDMFRNEKLASLVYACEGIPVDKKPVLEISSTMDIGENPECTKGDIYIFTNADSVKMYKNDKFIKEYFPKDLKFKNLSRGPILIDDYIGNAIDEGEKYSKTVKKGLKKIANSVAVSGLSHMSFKTLLQAAGLMVFHGLKYDDAVEIFNKYVGDWGTEPPVYRFDAIAGGEVVKSVTKAPLSKVSFDVRVSHTELVHDKAYDAALVRIRAVDDYGNQVYYFNEPIKLHTEGPIEVIGPDVISFKGGMAGVYIRTKNLLPGEVNPARLDIENLQCGDASVEFIVKRTKR